MLALLPLDPRAGVVAGGEPAVDAPRAARGRAEPPRERELGELDAEAPAQLASERRRFSSARP